MRILERQSDECCVESFRGRERGEEEGQIEIFETHHF